MQNTRTDMKEIRNSLEEANGYRELPLNEGYHSQFSVTGQKEQMKQIKQYNLITPYSLCRLTYSKRQGTVVSRQLYLNVESAVDKIISNLSENNYAHILYHNE